MSYINGLIKEIPYWFSDDVHQKDFKGTIDKYHSTYMAKKTQKGRLTSTYATPTQPSLIPVAEVKHSHRPHYGYKHHTTSNTVNEDVKLIKTTTSLSTIRQHTNPRIHITTNRIHIPESSTSLIPRIEIHRPEVVRHHGSSKHFELDKSRHRVWSSTSTTTTAEPKTSIGQLHTRVHRKFIELIHRNKVDDDQTVMVLVVNSIPNLFSIRQGDWFDAFSLYSINQSQFGK
uniref:Uncharacterized protein n=1 Tax=Heterorhabditis bacteriophora TaxID=37862 RepID=A0A1I7XKA1_HETBA